MNFDFFDGFSDPYMKTDSGKGIFVAGIVLGMVARGQGGGQDVDGTPLFKQLNFGRMKKRDIAKHMSRVPELVGAYRLKYGRLINALAAQGGELLLAGNEREIGVDGNFAFSVAFLNANKYFWSIFKSDAKDMDDDQVDMKGDN